MKRTIISTGLALVLLLAVGCAPEDEAAPAPEQEGPDQETAEEDPVAEDIEPANLSLSAYPVEGHWATEAEAAFAEAIEEASGGAITVELHHGGVLAPITEHGRSLRDGIVDIAQVASPYEAELFPVTDWIGPVAYRPERTPGLDQLQAHAGSIEWGFTDVPHSQYTQHGILPLLPEIQVHHHYFLQCTEPVTSLAAARGNQVRNPGAAFVGHLRAVDMEPVDLPAAEAYEAFQRGVMDCALGHPRDWLPSGTHEVAPHVMYDEEVAFPGFLSFGLYMNQATWDSLSLGAQQAIWDSLPVFLETVLTGAFAVDDEFYGDPRIEVHQFEEDLRQAIRDYQSGLRDSLLESPPEGLSEDEAEETIADYEASIDRWGTIIVDELGYEFPDSPEDFDSDQLDLQPFLDRLWEEVLEPQRPS